jgi:hypothetical protein
MNKNIIIIAFTLAILVSLQNSVLAAPLELTVATSKPSFNLGERITARGNLTLNGNPLPDGLVTLEIRNPRQQLWILRTQTTGSDPPQPWAIEITGLYPCDAAGNLKTTVNQGGNIGFKVSIRNNFASTYAVILPLYIQYSNNIPFTVFIVYNGTIEGGQTQSIVSYPVPIDSTAPLGITSVYANALTDLPTQEGFAYCPEEKTTFTITSSALSGLYTTAEDKLISIMSNEVYNISFVVSSRGGIIGNYTINASSRYSFYVAFASTRFPARLITDIMGIGGQPDGRVDIMDIALVSSCYGSYPGHPKWKPQADINKDNKVDVIDLSMVSHDFGSWGVLP